MAAIKTAAIRNMLSCFAFITPAKEVTGSLNYLRTFMKRVIPPAIRAMPRMICMKKGIGPPNKAAKGEPNRKRSPSPISIIPKKTLRNVPIRHEQF